MLKSIRQGLFASFKNVFAFQYSHGHFGKKYSPKSIRMRILLGGANEKKTYAQNRNKRKRKINVIHRKK